MTKISRTSGMLPALVMSLALSLAVLLIDQGLNLVSYGEVLGSSASLYYLTPLLLLGFAVAFCSSITGLVSLRPSRFAVLMVLPIAYMAGLALLYTQLSPSAGYGAKQLVACGMPLALGSLYLLLVVRQLDSNRLVLWAGILLQLLAIYAWMAVNPEKPLPLPATARFSLQAGLIGFLFMGCFWMGVRLPRPVIHPAMFAGAAAFGLLCVLLLSSPPGSALDLQYSKAAADRQIATRGVPNILWIVLDTLRSDHLPFYGYSRATAPFLEEFSRECVIYENVVSTAGWTLPSHASMFTGLYVREHGAHRGAGVFRALDEDKITVAEILRHAGYRTGAFSANNGTVTPATGLAQGFDFFHNFTPLPMQMIRADLIHFAIYHFGSDGSEELLLPYPTARVVSEAALRWVDARGDAPWFLFLNYMEAHRPHVTPPSRRDLFPGRLRGAYDLRHRIRAVRGEDSFTEGELAHFGSQYDSQIRTLDDGIRMLISGLEQRSGLDDLLILITSDHGEYLGEHDRVSHGSGLFDQLLRVPLMIRYPGKQRVGAETDLTSIVQIPAILFEALPWQSLVVDPVHRARAEAILERHELMSKSRFFISEAHFDGARPGEEHPDGYAVHDGRFKLISSPWNGEELYDLVNDPSETTNVLANHPGVARRLRGILRSYKRTVTEKTGDAVALESKETLEALRALGYIE